MSDYNPNIIDDGFDTWFWCPECGEPREVCESLKQCPIWKGEIDGSE